MDFTNLLDMGMIGAILMFTEFIKSLDKDNKFTRFYPVVPLLLGVVAAFATAETITFQTVVAKIILYVGPATYIYKFGKTTVMGK